MAVLHVTNSRGIVCAAPTGGSAGVIPGVVVTLAQERKAPDRGIALGLLAASAVGVVFARRATFAAEVAGCQVEIGAAGAMAAAAVVEMAGGRAGQAMDAAAVALQNTMGSVCDLVQGMCEIPCHTRNAAAAASAFVCADLVLGGYRISSPWTRRSTRLWPQAGCSRPSFAARRGEGSPRLRRRARSFASRLVFPGFFLIL